jgi:hypothetical protein
MGFELDLDIIYDLMFFEPPPKIHHLFLQFLLYTMMVFDEWYNWVPMAYIITSSYKQRHLTPQMDALIKRFLMFQNDLASKCIHCECCKGEDE